MLTENIMEISQWWSLHIHWIYTVTVLWVLLSSHSECLWQYLYLIHVIVLGSNAEVVLFTEDVNLRSKALISHVTAHSWKSLITLLDGKKPASVLHSRSAAENKAHPHPGQPPPEKLEEDIQLQLVCKTFPLLLHLTSKTEHIKVVSLNYPF